MAVLIYFGVPGSGKTTHAAKIVKKNLKRGVPTFCNVNIKGSIKIDASDIGKISMTDGELIIDEAAIVFNNRNFKSLPKYTIEWFKLARHYGIRNIHVYSQSYDDMDITLRRLADILFIIKRTLIPGLIVQKEISRRIGINQDTHQIEDQFFFGFLKIKLTWGPRYWRMFDSWEAPDLPVFKYEFAGFPHVPVSPETMRLLYRSI